MWLDISSAPKTAPEILLLTKHGAYVGYRDLFDRSWRLAGGRGLTIPDPTHWQPIPPPPASASPESSR